MSRFPSVCHGCGEKVDRRKSYWLETLEPSQEKRTWHMRCRLAVIKERVAAQAAELAAGRGRMKTW